MKKLLILSLITILITLKSYASDGRGELQLSENAVDSFIRYLKGDISKNRTSSIKPLVFWITVDGNSGYWWYCAHSSCTPGNASIERKACEKSTGVDCKRFARGRTIRWDNGINRKGNWSKFNSKMSEFEIKEKLTLIGFYNNSIIEEKVTNNDDTANQLKKLEILKKLFDDGLITPDEFILRKENILN